MKDLMARFSGFGIDTSVVLLFLAVEVGRSGNFGTPEALFMALGMLMLLVLPYFLPSAADFEPSLAKWLVFRGFVAGLGLSVGLILPPSMWSLPMNFLILTGICSCFFQFYGLMKLRLAD